MPAARERLDRWVPAAAMLLVSLISYIDRTTLALLAPTILRETGLNAQQYGLIVSAFSVAYMAGNPLWGRILDRAGLRRGMTGAVACWTVASMAHALAAGFWSFGAARAALGFGEGATFPGGLRTVVQTLPPGRHGRGLAVAYSGGSLGAAITPLVVTPIFLKWGWRGAFWFTGLIGALWLVVWSVVARRPDIRKIPPPMARSGGAPRLSDPRLWAFMCAYALGALPLGFVLYIAPLYLGRAMGQSQVFIGKVLWIPPLGWETGYFVWGWLADRALRSGRPRTTALRRLLTVCAVLSLPFSAAPWLPNVGAVMGGMFVAMFAASGFVVLSVTYATDVFSPAHAGLIAGAGAGSWSLAVAVTMPLFGWLFDQHRYTAAFWIATAVSLAGYLGWLGLSRRAGGTDVCVSIRQEERSPVNSR